MVSVMPLVSVYGQFLRWAHVERLATRDKHMILAYRYRKSRLHVS